MKNRLPLWFRQELPGGQTLEKIRLLSKYNIHTVCQEAKCPNLARCFNKSRLTFLILGNICTRNCKFCAVTKVSQNKLSLDRDEPYRISRIVRELGLKYVVVTSVTRDDLIDGGAAVFAKTTELIRRQDKSVEIELLIPDFCGKYDSLKTVVIGAASVIGHNIETVSRLYKELRPQADYNRSLSVLAKIKDLKPGITTKSSIMLGLAETEEEVIRAMQDLKRANCDILVLGQYLAPSKDSYPVREFISLEQFERYRRVAEGLGFRGVLSGPKVRSSYLAEETYRGLAYV